MKLRSVFFAAVTFLPTLLLAQINLSGDLGGYHDYTGQDVYIQTGDTIRIIPYGYNTDFDSTGWLYIKATHIFVNGVIDGRGRGYGGGGGGGGGTYGSVGTGGSDNGPFEGALGGDATSGAGGSGGDGGGIGGYSGQYGQATKGGKGGKGTGLFGGFGGLGGDPNGDGYNGQKGGYRNFEVNGDTTNNLAVFMGSGGGGGGGGGGGYRAGGGNGGAGGVEGGMGATKYQLRQQLNSGGGGGGGGAGGAALSLFAHNHIIVTGSIVTDGAGCAELGGGYGAGGGILLRADTIEISGLVKTLGGTSRKGSDVSNGGTIKLADNTLIGDVPAVNAGRILKRGMSIDEMGSRPVYEEALRLFPFEPNPGRTKVVIRYQLSHADRIAVKIFDCTGKLAATVVDQNQSSGIHSVLWDGSHFSSGVYFCQVTTAGTTKTKPITLVK